MDVLLLCAIAVLLVVDSMLRTTCWKEAGLTPLGWIVYIASGLLPAVGFLMPQFHLLFFYFFYFVVCMLQQELSPIHKGQFHNSGRLRFILFTSIHLSMMGCLALIAHYQAQEVLTNHNRVLYCTVFSLFIYTSCRALLVKKTRKNTITIDEKRREMMRLLIYFLNINIVYIFFQAMLCSFHDFIEGVMSYLLISNLITFILLLSYLKSLTKIFAIEEAEMSHRSLHTTLRETNRRLQKLRDSAHYDSLTGAASRSYLMKTVTGLLEDGVDFSLIYIDLNGLKRVNDTYGHQAGDRYLVDFVEQVRLRIREDDMIARMGGDEFVIVLPLCSRMNAIMRLQKIRDSLCEARIQKPFSAGIVSTEESRDLRELLSLADQRMYGEKRGETV